MGIKSNLFRVDCTQDVVKDFTKDNLQNYDIVMFYTTGGRRQLPIAEDALEYLLGTWLKQKGHGFIGAHSAADTYADYQPYWDMIGGSFNGHPWGSGENGDRDRPRHGAPDQQAVGRRVRDQGRDLSLQELAAGESPRADEPEHGQDQAQGAVPRAHRLVQGVRRRQGVSHEPGPQRSVWEDARYMQSMLGGIKWILGLEKGDATPNPELSKAEEEKAKADVAAAK